MILEGNRKIEKKEQVRNGGRKREKKLVSLVDQLVDIFFYIRFIKHTLASVFILSRRTVYEAVTQYVVVNATVSSHTVWRWTREPLDLIFGRGAVDPGDVVGPGAGARVPEEVGGYGGAHLLQARRHGLLLAIPRPPAHWGITELPALTPRPPPLLGFPSLVVRQVLHLKRRLQVVPACTLLALQVLEARGAAAAVLGRKEGPLGQVGARMVAAGQVRVL